MSCCSSRAQYTLPTLLIIAASITVDEPDVPPVCCVCMLYSLANCLTPAGTMVGLILAKTTTEPSPTANAQLLIATLSGQDGQQLLSSTTPWACLHPLWSIPCCRTAATPHILAAALMVAASVKVMSTAGFLARGQVMAGSACPQKLCQSSRRAGQCDGLKYTSGIADSRCG
jgi:hypothetical protein